MMINVELVEETEMERDLTTNGALMITFGLIAGFIASFANNYLGLESHYLLTSALMVSGIGSILCGYIKGELNDIMLS